MRAALSQNPSMQLSSCWDARLDRLPAEKVVVVPGAGCPVSITYPSMQVSS